MKPDYKKMFEKLAWEQKHNGLTPTCPRCGKDTVRHMDAIANAVSRYEDITICHFCGENEAMRELEKPAPLPVYQWHFIREILSGCTFEDLLSRNKELDCALIIDDSDMPADFVWDQESIMSAAGIEYYAEIMQAPYEVLSNGNIEIFCNNYELGKDFCLSAAGHTSIKRYNLYFREGDLIGMKSLDTSGIVLDDEL